MLFCFLNSDFGAYSFILPQFSILQHSHNLKKTFFNPSTKNWDVRLIAVALLLRILIIFPA